MLTTFCWQVVVGPLVWLFPRERRRIGNQLLFWAAWPWVIRAVRYKVFIELEQINYCWSPDRGSTTNQSHSRSETGDLPVANDRAAPGHVRWIGEISSSQVIDNKTSPEPDISDGTPEDQNRCFSPPKKLFKRSSNKILLESISIRSNTWIFQTSFQENSERMR